MPSRYLCQISKHPSTAFECKVRQVIFNHSKTSLENQIKITQIKSVCFHNPTIKMCKFGLKPSIPSGYSTDKAFLNISNPSVTLIMGLRSPKSNHYCPCPKSIHLFERVQTSHFSNILRPHVILNMGPWSPKSYHLFFPLPIDVSM